ncbi:polyphenol oxidase family protein [Patescibacteria group bacterium]|nr:polyphenol oxidase family protein [Patescibacteria group bacterium]
MFIQSKLLDPYVLHGFTTKAMGDMSLIRNTDGKAEQHNQALYDFLGISQNELTIVNPKLNHGANFAFVKSTGRFGYRSIDFDSPETKYSQRITTVATEDLHPIHDTGIDACFTKDPRVVLTMRPADCAVLFVVDPIKNSFGLIHAGTASITSDGVWRAIKFYIFASGTKPENVLVFVSPSITAKAYNLTKSGLWQRKLHKTIKLEDALHYDPQASILQQLLNAGLKRKNIQISSFCTASDHALFFSNHTSLDPTKEGRMLALIGTKHI